MISDGNSNNLKNQSLDIYHSIFLPFYLSKLTYLQ